MSRGRRKRERQLLEGSRTFITLHQRTGGFADPEWFGMPDGETGVFTIGGRYVIRFLELSIGNWPESVVGPDKLILSMRYHASLVTGEAWVIGDEPFSMVPGGKWWFDGRDDLGTAYEYQQGASGFPDADHTVFDSGISFEPDVPVNASWIEIRFTEWRSPGQPVHTFRADVPPLQSILAP